MECSNLDKSGDEEVKSLGSKLPPSVRPGGRAMKPKTEGQEVLSQYIPPKLPFYGDYFALARLLADYKQFKTTGQRLPWDCHILSDANFAHAFWDLDQKLFGDFPIKDLVDRMDSNTEKARFAHASDDFIASEFGLIKKMHVVAPAKFRGLINSNLFRGLKKAQKQSSFVRGLDNPLNRAWYRLNSLTRDKETGEYNEELVSRVVDLYLDACTTIKITMPDYDLFQMLFGLAYSVNKYKDEITPLMRDLYFENGIYRLKQLPAGETILYHSGLGPKPAAKLDYTGCRFGFLVVEAPAAPVAKREGRVVRRQAVTCRCDCGKLVKVAVADFPRGRAISCGTCGRPKSLTAKTVQVWARATLENAEANKARRKQRHGYEFNCSGDVLYYCGLWPRPLKYDLSRTNDHLRQDTPYAPGLCYWQDKRSNRAVEDKALHTFNELNQRVMLEEMPVLKAETTEFDPEFRAFFGVPLDDSL